MKNIRGVNLGGWLVLEKWITPDLFENSNIKDDEGSYKILHEKGLVVPHWETYLTENDFKTISDYGLNSVRLPLPYWLFYKEEPFSLVDKYVERVFEWAHRYGISVLLDLHTTPFGPQDWKNNPSNCISTCISTIEEIVLHYGNKDNLIGVELFNEPDWSIPHRVLADYYEQGYQTVRKNARHAVSVVINDGFRPLDWHHEFNAKNYPGIILDMHLYQCFTDKEREMSVDKHLQKVLTEQKDQIIKVQNHLPVVIGEWSAGLDPKSLVGLEEDSKASAFKAYAAVQKYIYAQSVGWYFWTYKTQAGDAWDYTNCKQKGWL